ncbi:MAG: hypothetical protein K9N09_08265 [Candidatus Cloacimonetes bacterium]|nr:hypothetical protein [Candidatus Cloacimonadota bacterium]MCF7813538.1 hypothetical protein [Candidatus Cloacimonadota bacterium]MCF7868678.1 hypothetical protein [Candidatus Cloacimonadota bacterium]MCF7884192.1 hypothetical protein [Candidatus Cloacimonadota bacterium]
MNSNLFKILEFLIVLICTIFFSAVVCFVLDYKLFSISNFGFQLFIFALLTTFINFSNKYLKLMESIILAAFWGFVLAYFLKRTSVFNDFGSFYMLLLYTELLMISFALVYTKLWKARKVHLRGLLFSIFAAVAYTFVHLFMHQILAMQIDARQVLYYFSNGLVITLTMSFALNIAFQINNSIQKNFFSK